LWIVQNLFFSIRTFIIYMITGEMFFVKVEMYAADWQQAAQHLLLWRVPFSRQTQAHIGKPPRLSFSYFHWFLVFFIMHISTYWNLMLWYIKHIYFQKLLIYVKVRDTNLAICFLFFRLMDFSYEIVMAIYIEEVIRGEWSVEDLCGING